MSINSSSNSSLDSFIAYCTNSKAFISIPIFMLAKAVLILPLSTAVLCLAHQRWRQQRFLETTNHSDIFTYHLAAMELVETAGLPLFFYGLSTELTDMLKMAVCISAITNSGEILFHVLTSVERYLAVVHPVTYLGLKKEGGVRIRNIIIGCVWLLSFGWSCLIAVHFPTLPTIPFSCLLISSFLVVSFCSLSVLCVLIRPGPGEASGNRERVDQSKQRAFNMIMAITGVLWLWFAGYLVCLAVESSSLLSNSDGCLVAISGIWFGLPSSVVLPLLFLHRAGKLPFFHNNAN